MNDTRAREHGAWLRRAALEREERHRREWRIVLGIGAGGVAVVALLVWLA